MVAHYNDDLIYTFFVEKDKRIRNGAYGLTQRELAYNSNKIEGSTLTKKHTETLFNEGIILSSEEETYRPKDIEEMQGHFAMFNYMLETLSKPLSPELIKGFHKQLKQCVFEDIANGYNIGEYKSRQNYIGDFKTVAPNEVSQKMNELLGWYLVQNPSYSVLAEFHLKYERIHPFQDGNGRTGRIILFRECLTNNLKPFIIQDSSRSEYLRALANNDCSALTKLFKNAATEYESMLEGSLMSAPKDWSLCAHQEKSNKEIPLNL